MVIFGKDLLIKLENEFNRVLRESREDWEAVPQDVREIIQLILEQGSEVERRKILQRLALSNHNGHEANLKDHTTDDKTDPAALPALSVDEPRYRSATLERELRELKALNADLQGQLRAVQLEAAQCSTQLDERSTTLRAFERRDESAQAEIARLRDQVVQSQSAMAGLEARLHETNQVRKELSQRVIELETRLFELRAEKPAQSKFQIVEPNTANAAVPPPSTPPPVKPDAPSTPQRGGVRDRFVECLVQTGLLSKTESEALNAESEARLGEFAAIMITFQQKVHKIVEAQLSTLAERLPGIQALLENLRALGKGDRLWLWCLTFGGKKQNPMRSLELYLSELQRLTLCMFAAYHWSLTKAVKENATALASPFAVQKEAKSDGSSDYWEFYEHRYFHKLPNQLADRCLHQAVIKIEELFNLERP